MHINSPIPDHALDVDRGAEGGQARDVHRADGDDDRGVPARSVELVKKTGLKYMMAETVVYSREFLFIKEMYKKGELGKIQHLAASHPQDMDGWPDYWERMIPMHYATHVVSPCLGLVDGRAEYVSCFGCGHGARGHREEVRQQVRRRDRATSRSRTRTSRPTSGGSCTTSPGSIARALTSTARRRASSGRWSKHEPHVIHTAKKPEPEIPSKVEVPDFAHLLPEPIRQFTQPANSRRRAPVVHPRRRPRRLASAPGQRVRLRPWSTIAIRGRTPCTSANWTCVGILCPSVGAEGRRNRAAAGVHAG